MTEIAGESALEQPLLDWLEGKRRIRSDTILVRELSWFGRRVDLVTLTTSGKTAAYELKLRDNKRALQQASYNRLAFDRSYIVTASRPSDRNQQRAISAGVGVIVVSKNEHTLLCEASLGAEHKTLRRRLLGEIREKAKRDVW